MIVDNQGRGFYMAGNATELSMDDVVSRGDGGYGISLWAPDWSGEDYKTDATVGTIYAIDNGHKSEKPGVALVGPMDLRDAERIETCRNAGAGLRGVEAYGGPPTGSITELVTRDNGRGNTRGNLQEVTIQNAAEQRCDPPDVLPKLSESAIDC
ncbi:MAG: hypothetical protein ABEN55_19840 [Bradymonadaceae bacterium]